MTALDIRASINTELNGFTPDMLQMVADYVKSLRRKKTEEPSITPLVASLFTGHSVSISDMELEQAKEVYLKEKYL